MLSINGLVIIASEVQELKRINDSISQISFQVSSDTLFKTTIRYPIEVVLGQQNIEEFKSKLVIGSICQIVHGNFYESGKYSKIVNGNKEVSGLILKVDYKNIKFLAPCIYYENLKNITTKE